MLNDEDNDRREVAKKLSLAIASIGDGGKARLANKCGVTPQAITGWEKDGKITFLNLVKVAIETNKSLEFFAPDRLMKIAEPITGYSVDIKNTNYNKALAILDELFIYQQNKWLAQADEYLIEARAIRSEMAKKEEI